MKFHLYPFDAVYKGRRYIGTYSECRLLARFQFVTWVLMREDGLAMAWTINAGRHIAALKMSYAKGVVAAVGS